MINFKVFVPNQVFIINLQNNHHINRDYNPAILYALCLTPYAS